MTPSHIMSTEVTIEEQNNLIEAKLQEVERDHNKVVSDKLRAELEEAVPTNVAEQVDEGAEAAPTTEDQSDIAAAEDAAVEDAPTMRPFGRGVEQAAPWKNEIKRLNADLLSADPVTPAQRIKHGKIAKMIDEANVKGPLGRSTRITRIEKAIKDLAATIGDAKAQIGRYLEDAETTAATEQPATKPAPAVEDAPADALPTISVQFNTAPAGDPPEWHAGSDILKTFNDQFGHIPWENPRVRRLITEIPAKVAEDTAYRNVRENPDRQNARIEHDEALNRVMTTDVFNEDKQLYKEFTDNEGFRQWLTDNVFELTYKPLATGEDAPAAPATEEPTAPTAPADDEMTDEWRSDLMRLDVAILDLARTWRMPKARPNIIEDTPVTLRADHGRIFEMFEKLPREQVEKAIKDLSTAVERAAAGQDAAAPTTIPEEADERTRQEGEPGQVRPDGDRSLGGVPATEVQGPEGGGDTDSERLRGPGEDEGSGDTSTRQGDADTRGRGTGPDRVDTAGSRGGTRERPAVKVTGNDFTAPEGFEAEIESPTRTTRAFR